jgi:hypothetical protein
VAWMEAIDRRLAALADGDEPAWPTGSRRVAETTDLAAIREAAMAATFNPAYRVSRCGQQSAHGPHVVRSGPDQPRNCPGGPAWSWSFVPVADTSRVEGEMIMAEPTAASPADLVALTMTPDAGRAFWKALIAAAARIPEDARTKGDETSYVEWLEWGASRLDLALRVAFNATQEVRDEA